MLKQLSKGYLHKEQKTNYFTNDKSPQRIEPKVELKSYQKYAAVQQNPRSVQKTGQKQQKLSRKSGAKSARDQSPLSHFTFNHQKSIQNSPERAYLPNDHMQLNKALSGSNSCKNIQRQQQQKTNNFVQSPQSSSIYHQQYPNPSHYSSYNPSLNPSANPSSNVSRHTIGCAPTVTKDHYQSIQPIRDYSSSKPQTAGTVYHSHKPSFESVVSRPGAIFTQPQQKPSFKSPVQSSFKSSYYQQCEYTEQKQQIPSTIFSDEKQIVSPLQSKKENIQVIKSFEQRRQIFSDNKPAKKKEDRLIAQDVLLEMRSKQKFKEQIQQQIKEQNIDKRKTQINNELRQSNAKLSSYTTISRQQSKAKLQQKKSPVRENNANDIGQSQQNYESLFQKVSRLNQKTGGNKENQNQKVSIYQQKIPTQQVFQNNQQSTNKVQTEGKQPQAIQTKYIKYNPSKKIQIEDVDSNTNNSKQQVPYKLRKEHKRSNTDIVTSKDYHDLQRQREQDNIYASYETIAQTPTQQEIMFYQHFTKPSQDSKQSLQQISQLDISSNDHSIGNYTSSNGVSQLILKSPAPSQQFDQAHQIKNYLEKYIEERKENENIVAINYNSNNSGGSNQDASYFNLNHSFNKESDENKMEAQDNEEFTTVQEQYYVFEYQRKNTTSEKEGTTTETVEGDNYQHQPVHAIYIENNDMLTLGPITQSYAEQIRATKNLDLPLQMESKKVQSCLIKEQRNSVKKKVTINLEQNQMNEFYRPSSESSYCHSSTDLNNEKIRFLDENLNDDIVRYPIRDPPEISVEDFQKECQQAPYEYDEFSNEVLNQESNEQQQIQREIKVLHEEQTMISEPSPPKKEAPQPLQQNFIQPQPENPAFLPLSQRIEHFTKRFFNGNTEQPKLQQIQNESNKNEEKSCLEFTRDLLKQYRTKNIVK